MNSPEQTPSTAIFPFPSLTQQLMASNEALMIHNRALMDRTERLMDQQEAHVRLLATKEDIIMKLKRALECEKERRERNGTEICNELMSAQPGQSTPGEVQVVEGAREPPGAWNDSSETEMLDMPAKRLKVEHPAEPNSLASIIAKHFPTYVFKAVVDGSAQYIQLGDLAPVVTTSLCRTLERFQARRERLSYIGCPDIPTKALVSCGELWMHDCASTHAWTTRNPGRYACKTCFNARRACFVWSEGNWIILPVPPGARDAGATYTDAAYYVNQRLQTTAKSFPGVWGESSGTIRKRQRRMDGAGVGVGGGYVDGHLTGLVTIERL